jgi:NTP pyrophosphatase (non-canonical NTP hydrolase)
MVMMNKQDEILLILQEECAELIQAVSKVKRFGLEYNKEQLQQEMADVLCMINLVFEYGIVEKNDIDVKKRIERKENRLKEFSNIYNDYYESDHYAWSVSNFGSPNGS